MVGFEPNNEGIRRVYEEAGARLKETLDAAVQDTADLPLDEAVTTTEQRLARIGVDLGPGQTREAVETMRRGEPFKIVLT